MNQEEDNIIPIRDNQVHFLFKRGKKEHIEALFEKGEVYINSIDSIRTWDDNKERSDEDDGINFRKYIGNAKIIMCEIGKDAENESIELNAINTTIKQDNITKGNIYCLTGIYSDDLQGERNEIKYETQSFGETIILIRKPQIFLNRVFSELEKLGYKNYKSGRVSYYKNDYSGEINFFKKHEKFKSQNEFRIFISNDKNIPLKVTIGSLKDIACLVNAAVIKIKYTDEREQFIYL
ncbi:hypothetical protein SAMN05421741_10381 [Paenimyroides ummariense]|uniref:Uncharacterized protein n=1 Tax=Paenimyroides ummariense TaxID=913024 RepID=A0A1I4XRB4_9FLAO|nr:hypothetical protein [Paenimyroides ummariense]SFN27829.1 hypothetical protein SAMN05421741_10381 [Paenimyroides ummariense]